MKQFLTVCLMLALGIGCKQPAPDSHAHNADGSHPEEGPAAISYTQYSKQSELFVEFKPLIVGKTSSFATHLTVLGEVFKPLTRGKVTLSLIINGKGIRTIATEPGSPGIFRLALQPVTAGTGKLVFTIESDSITDEHIIEPVVVYADEQSASSQPAAATTADISFLKEQAWRISFANEPATYERIIDQIKVTGQLIAAPDDQVTMAAPTAGILQFSGNQTILGTPVRKGTTLFTIKGAGLTTDNIDATVQAAKAEANTASIEYERAKQLMADKLITATEYQAAELRYRNSQIQLKNLTNQYGQSGKSVTAPINGFLGTVLVNDGQYVQPGQPLAVISQNKRILLKADLPMKHAASLKKIKGADFTILQNDQLYTTETLQGKLISFATTTSPNLPAVPLHFEIDNRPEFLPGSFADVFLKTDSLESSITIPVTALLEEQGNFSVYVQTAGESFQKREVQTGARDGKRVQILTGIKQGERVVTKGAYQIKLASASSALPAHGHEH